MKTILIQFRCGHFEKQNRAEIKKQNIQIDSIFTINKQEKATSGQYCLGCSMKSLIDVIK